MSLQNTSRVIAARNKMQVKNQQSQIAYLKKKKEKDAIQRRQKIENFEKMRYGCPGVTLGATTNQTFSGANHHDAGLEAARERMQQQNQVLSEYHKEKEKERESIQRRRKIEMWEKMNQQDSEDRGRNQVSDAPPPQSVNRDAEMAAARERLQQRYRESMKQNAKSG